MNDSQLAKCLILTHGDVLLASVLAGITAVEFSERLKRSEVIQEAQAEVGADNLVFEEGELRAAVYDKQPWAIMLQLESTGRIERAEQPDFNLN